MTDRDLMIRYMMALEAILQTPDCLPTGMLRIAKQALQNQPKEK